MRITKIFIAAGDCIDSIKFTYDGVDGVNHGSPAYGGNGGTNHMITFVEGEVITRITGTFGEHGQAMVITSLSIDTNKGTHGPYGKNVGTGFSLPVTKGKFIGFYGTYGDYIQSFGAILQPFSN
ncbi:hypothetical protein L6452_35888 [Arctium lappa]|uniref:Uncharacterized protein n=1 Tax=Arctium lappa TaxID=4217 RepID=A0ACB8Y7P3_ARCLA|nr:hypothetical protein L6452_35888 [Arctium lappa]